MKYISIKNVVAAYQGFQECMTNKSWGFLALLKGCNNRIAPSAPYEINLDEVSYFLESIFNLGQNKKKYNSGRTLYAVFSNKWEKYFSEQGKYVPNIYDVAIWAYRRVPFEDSISTDDIIQKFTNDFNIPLSVLSESFDTSRKDIEFTDTLYAEANLKAELKVIGVDVSKENIDAKKGSVVASPGEISRGPFVQTLYAGLEITDYVLILQSNFQSLYGNTLKSSIINDNIITKNYLQLKPYLSAMRTKPFLLLAGISGTGKSRIVKQLAFESCPDIAALRKDPTSPGNYELIEVKPNWHDSTEVLGYESEIGKPHYVLTPFVKFLVKAMLYEDRVPFFVCMDEMNLAPVEQYFAEFLSVLESRKLIDGKITSEPLIKADIFVKYEDQLCRDLFDISKEAYLKNGEATQDPKTLYGKASKVFEQLKTNGLRIPSNLIVIGTVNMDETTHQFSRKVIDRAMTIEMNIEDAETPFQDFFNGSDALHYYDSPQPRELFLPKVVQAADALAELKEEDADYLKANVPQLLFKLNRSLDGTPFKIAYRVQNELVLYFYALRQEQPEEEAEKLLASAMDAILMMKVLPRIEGDEDLLGKPLKELAEFTTVYPQASKKITEMQQRLPQAHFTSFWP